MQRKPIFTGLRNFSSKSKKLLDAEKEIQSQKKNAKNASVKPRGYIARKAGSITFWVLFGFMFLVVIVNMFGSDSSKAEDNDKTAIVQKNYAESPESIQFAKDFIQSYFTWNISEEGKALRIETMSKYLALGLDQYAGLNFSGLEWNSVYKGCVLKKVEGKGDNLAHVTYLVDFELEKNEGTEVNRVQKYFVVPVAYDGETFGIYELPKYTYVYEDTTLKKVAASKYKTAEVRDTEGIRDFLTTFFRSYAEDPKDKLNYILTADDVTDGLNKSMLFEKVNKSNIFKGKKENTFIVFTEVSLIEPVTNVSIKANYQLSVVKKNNRYIVSGIDDQNNEKIETRGPEDYIEETEEKQHQQGEKTEEVKQQAEITNIDNDQVEQQKTN